MVCFKISKIIIHLIVFYIANLLKYRDITSEEFLKIPHFVFCWFIDCYERE